MSQSLLKAIIERVFEINVKLITLTIDDIRREVQRRVADLAPAGGFVFCPVQNIQAGVAPENIIAMYDELGKWDRYPIRLTELKKSI